MNRFADFFFKEQSIRWKAYGLSSVVAFTYGLINLFVLHRDEQQVSMESVIVLLTLISLSVGLYVAHVRGFDEEKAPKPKIFGLRLAAAGALAATFVAFVFYVGIPKMQATIIELRLQLFIANPTVYAAYAPDQQVQKRVQVINSIVDASSHNQIPVDPKLLAKAQTVLSDDLKARTVTSTTKQAGLITSAKMTGLIALAKTAGQTFAPAGANAGNRVGYFINSTLELNEKNLRLQGSPHAPLTFGDDGRIVISNSTIIFDGLDLRARQPYQEVLFLDSSSTVVVRDGTVENLDQTLDGVLWEDVRFEHSIVRVRGGGISLVNVSFDDCDLRWLAFSKIGSELQEKIREAKGKPFSFAFEGDAVGLPLSQ